MFTPRPKVAPSRHGGRRTAYLAAAVDRLTADFTASTLSADAAIWSNLRTLRDRARAHERNNPYARKYLSDCEKNVLGRCGVNVQLKARLPDGSYDKAANDLIEAAWAKWGKRQFASVTKRLNWPRLQRLVLRTLMRDGETFVRMVRGFPNDFGFSLQVIEGDHIDHDYNDRLQGGNEVRMGVELNVWKEPVAYYFLPRHPGEIFGMGSHLKRERIDAHEIIHLFIPERAGQTRGVPSMTSVLIPLHNLDRYEEAELVASRVAAAKSLILEKTTPEGWNGESDDDGNTIEDISPGGMVELPMGMTAKPFDPTHPNTAYPEARKGFLRAIACGLGVQYANFAGDTESVNFSALRWGMKDEQEIWKMLQTFFVEDFITPVFEAWLEYAIMSGQLRLPLAEFDRWNSPDWKPRAFDYIDPTKDIQANILAVENGFKSRRAVIAEGGGDIEEVFDEMAADEALADEKGLEFGEPAPAPTPASALEEDEEEPEDEDDEERRAVDVAPATGKRSVRFLRDKTGRLSPRELSALDGAEIRFNQNGRLKGAELVDETGRVVKRVDFKHDDHGTLTGAKINDV